MIFKVIFVCLLSLSFPSYGREVTSRSVFRSGDEGAVNLMEFNFRGIIYGKCGFRSDGEEMSIVYEEKDGEIIAEAENPTILDPKSKVEMCREVASQKPINENKLRSGMDQKTGESPHEIALRFAEFEREMRSNEMYISQLRPRFLGLLGTMSNSNNYAISFGSLFNSSSFPGFAFSLPQFTAAQATLGFGFPFKSSSTSTFGKKKK